MPRSTHNDGGRPTGIDRKGVGTKPPAGALEGNLECIERKLEKAGVNLSGKYKETNGNEPLKTRRKLKDGVETKDGKGPRRSQGEDPRRNWQHPANRRRDRSTGAMCERGNFNGDEKRKVTNEKPS